MKKISIILLFLVMIVGCSSNTTTKTDQTPSAANETVTPNEMEEQTPVAGLPLLTASIAAGEHDVKGEFTVLDNNTIEATQLYYDGKAPDVYIVLGSIENDKFEPKLTVSTKLNALDGGKMTLILPEGTNIDDFDAISFWCQDFEEDFGSTRLVKV